MRVAFLVLVTSLGAACMTRAVDDEIEGMSTTGDGTSPIPAEPPSLASAPLGSTDSELPPPRLAPSADASTDGEPFEAGRSVESAEAGTAKTDAGQMVSGYKCDLYVALYMCPTLNDYARCAGYDREGFIACAQKCAANDTTCARACDADAGIPRDPSGCTQVTR